MQTNIKVLDLDEVVRLLKDKGVVAYVEQTGGGTATIYAGEQFQQREETWRWVDGVRVSNGSETVPRYPVIAGPGWFEGPGWTHPQADAGDFAIGPDDDGESDPVFTTATWTEADVAEEIFRQFKERTA